MTAPLPDGQPEVTLCDILTHIQGLRGEFTERMDRMEGRMDGMEGRMDRLENTLDTGLAQLHGRIDVLEEDLNERIDILEADLTVTIKETFVIRRHVGLSVAEDD